MSRLTPKEEWYNILQNPYIEIISKNLNYLYPFSTKKLAKMFSKTLESQAIANPKFQVAYKKIMINTL